MPNYTFENTRTKERIEILIPHSKLAEGYTDGSADVWERVFEPSAIRTETKNR